MQVELVPLQLPPDHPVKVELAPGVSVSVTLVPGLKAALQDLPQLIPEGLLVTVPVPVSVKLNTGSDVNVAMADVLPDTVKVQEPSPLHAPPHPPNIELPAGVAVREI